MPAAKGSVRPDPGTGIRYELAEEMLALLRTDSGRQLRHARETRLADDGDVARLAEVHARYVELRESLHRCNPAEIEDIIAAYGPLAAAAADASGR